MDSSHPSHTSLPASHTPGTDSDSVDEGELHRESLLILTDSGLSTVSSSLCHVGGCGQNRKISVPEFAEENKKYNWSLKCESAILSSSRHSTNHSSQGSAPSVGPCPRTEQLVAPPKTEITLRDRDNHTSYSDGASIDEERETLLKFLLQGHL